MIAVKRGATSFRQADVLASDEVEFTGVFVYEADGVTPAMVWDASLDAGVGNIRLMTTQERTVAKTALLHTLAKALVALATSEGVRFRSLVLVTLDAFNRNSKQFRDLLAAIAGATSLANLQTRAAAITPVEPPRTAQDLIDAINTKIDAGSADS